MVLAGARFQRVSIVERDGALAPLLRRLESVGAKAGAHASFRLLTGNRSPITVMPWPYPSVDLAQFYEVVDKATRQEQLGVTRVPGDFQLLRQRLPADFLGRVPIIYGLAGFDVDPNRNVFFSQGQKLYRVSKLPDCGASNTDCTLMRLRVEGILVGGASLEIPMPASPPMAGLHTAASPRVFWAIPNHPNGGKMMLDRPPAWLWPLDTGVKLADVAPAGRIVSSAEFERHKPLYASVLKTWTYGARGLNFVEDGVLYEEVRLCQVAPGSATGACEVIP